MMRLPFWLVPMFLAAGLGSVAVSAELELDGRRFTLPDGVRLERVAGPPLVDRPICVDFDESGRLYVAESSGTNADVQTQLRQRPHRILRLEDTDGDGHFDRRTTFADQMMFPEGVLWYDGSLYVAAPPAIWKLTDTNDDGVADSRETWFDGKTLTGCANDLHGPYLGRDGWIYWCKGAFAEQTYDRPGKPPFVTRAAHIFRRRPEGGIIEPVMTGGMDNPVEVVFTLGGERIFTTTFLEHPAEGRRDGLIHAIYGGVYGKQHGVLDGHPRTGDLMPNLVQLGAAAPCGLVCLASDRLGPDYQDNLLATLFNMHKVTRHALTNCGATFVASTEDFLVCDDLDFHPTDVCEDADGSVLVVNTGGWYKLCCPTSQLHKPDVLGAIYRIRRADASAIDDPRGLNLPWQGTDVRDLVQRLFDRRPVVCRRAMLKLSQRGSEAVPVLRQLLDQRQTVPARVRCHAVWTLCRIPDDAARAPIRQALLGTDSLVVQAAAHAAGLWRDRRARDLLISQLSADSPPVRRAAAEALGRLEDPRAVPALLSAAATEIDRAWEHSVTYALIEIAAPEATRMGLADSQPSVQRAALVALDQMPSGDLSPQDVQPLLTSPHAAVRDTALWVAGHHSEWGDQLVDYFRSQWTAAEGHDELSHELGRQILLFAARPSIQMLVARLLDDRAEPAQRRVMLLDVMANTDLESLPDVWTESLANGFTDQDNRVRAATVQAAARWARRKPLPESLAMALLQTARDAEHTSPLRLEALAAAAGSLAKIDDSLFSSAVAALHADNAPTLRSLAVDVVQRARLTPEQQLDLAEAVANIGPLELNGVLAAFKGCSSERVGKQLVTSLAQSKFLPAVDLPQFDAAVSSFPEALRSEARQVLERGRMSTADQLARLEELLAQLPAGDARRGQQLFHSDKAVCSACHAIGYLGGRIGPDLTNIGRIRTARDLVESIVFPNASFVRTYEPYSVVITDGRVINGLIKDESAQSVLLVTTDRQEVRIPRDQIEVIQPSATSIMPAGLDQQLSLGELADLVAFLQVAR